MRISLIIFAAIILLNSCKTNKELNQLRKQYIKSDEICDCDGIFELPEEYKTLNAFPKAIELIDSLHEVEAYSQKIIFFDDSLIRRTLAYNSPKSVVPAYIYIYIYIYMIKKIILNILMVMKIIFKLYIEIIDFNLLV